MSYLSEDGEEGYPSAVLTTVRFKLTPDNKLEISIRATTTGSTIVNISHGSLFNLAGHVINIFCDNVDILKLKLKPFHEPEAVGITWE
jgi:galactose mutarotase-like enzyme